MTSLFSLTGTMISIGIHPKSLEHFHCPRRARPELEGSSVDAVRDGQSIFSNSCDDLGESPKSIYSIYILYILICLYILLRCCYILTSYYLVVRRERFGAIGVFIFPIKSMKWGASWSYSEFPNHLVELNSPLAEYGPISKEWVPHGFGRFWP